MLSSYDSISSEQSSMIGGYAESYRVRYGERVLKLLFKGTVPWPGEYVPTGLVYVPTGVVYVPTGVVCLPAGDLTGVGVDDLGGDTFRSSAAEGLGLESWPPVLACSRSILKSRMLVGLVLPPTGCCFSGNFFLVDGRLLHHLDLSGESYRLDRTPVSTGWSLEAEDWLRAGETDREDIGDMDSSDSDLMLCLFFELWMMAKSSLADKDLMFLLPPWSFEGLSALKDLRVDEVTSKVDGGDCPDGIRSGGLSEDNEFPFAQELGEPDEVLDTQSDLGFDSEYLLFGVWYRLGHIDVLEEDCS